MDSGDHYQRILQSLSMRRRTLTSDVIASECLQDEEDHEGTAFLEKDAHDAELLSEEENEEN